MADAQEAVEFLRLVADADSTNRAEALEDLRFRYGDQWPVQIMQSRLLESRPALTINETDAYIRKIENQQRQQRPRMNPHPVGSKASIETAKVLKGLCRHIEVNSDADNAYDLAFSFALTMGWGYLRLRADYIREDSFDQDIYIDQVENPFTVYFDPNSSLPDGSDSEKALVTDVMSKEAFLRDYPGAVTGTVVSRTRQIFSMAGFTQRASGDTNAEWVTKEDIRLAEYFYVDRVKADLVKLSDGTVLYGDQLPSSEILSAMGMQIIGTRPSYKRSVKWCKQTAFEILEEKTLPGRWIPIIPVYGVHVFLDGKRKKFGLVKFAKDPARMVNFWQTTLTELVALAPKAKWLLAEGQDEGHENEFAQANVAARPVLRYKPTTVDGLQTPAPSRIAPEPVPAGALENAMLAGENLKRVLGVFDPQVKTDGNKSGKAINAERMQSEESNFNYYDNLTRSMKHASRIILDWTPKIYDTQRVVRIIGDDGKPDLVTVNEKREEGGVTQILNDLTVGEYDVVMDTGPGYNTKRLEAFDAFTELMQGPLGEIISKTGADLVVRLMDAPGMEVLADRLAAGNPLAQIDDKSEIPPKAQIMIKGLQQQLEQAHQMLQQATQEIHSRQSIAEIKEHGAILREQMKQKGDKEEREVTARQKRHDTETFALTSQNVAEINALAKILTSKTEHGHRLREMVLEFEHASALQDKELKAKSDENEPAEVQH